MAYELTQSRARTVRGMVMTEAERRRGTPYTTEGSYPAYEDPVPIDPPAFNCSGFTWWCYRAAGYPIPGKQSPGGGAEGSQYDLVHALGNWKTDVDELKPGDLCFYKIPGDKRISGHVAIYYGKRQVIHDYGSPGVCVTGYNDIGTFIGGGAPFITIPDPPKEDEVKPCIININDHDTQVYFDWHDVHDLSHPEDARILKETFKKVHGYDLPSISMNGAEFARLAQGMRSDWPKHLEALVEAWPSRSPEGSY